MSKNNLKLLEKKVEKFLRKKYPDSIIKKEYKRIGYPVQPDYAVFTKDKLIFVELKGNKDTLARLYRQLFHYQRIADSVIVFTDKKYKLDLKNRGIGTGILKKKKIKNFVEPGTYPERVTDILDMLYSSELDILLSFLNFKFNNIQYKKNTIKAIYTQFEIRKYAYNILYNRMKNNLEEGFLDIEISLKQNKINLYNLFEIGGIL